MANLQAAADALNAALNSRRPNLQAAADAFNAALNYSKQELAMMVDQSQVDIYLKEKNGTRQIRIPWLPDKIEHTTGQATVATHDILRKGPVDTPLGVGLEGLAWESFFPGANRTGLTGIRGTLQSPENYHNVIKDWKAKGTVLECIVTSYPANFDCYVFDYNGVYTGAFGDIEYNIELKEKKEVNIIVTTETDTSGGTTEGGTAEGDTTERPAEKTESYTIKSGDNMWSIAQQYLGDGSRWKEIYEANKEALDQAAADMGHSSNDGTWIFPGTTIAIPQS